ncbi:MAG: bacillithiol biosynthesis cysteine-adding enzyme BshC [Flavobacteriales bacterium]
MPQTQSIPFSELPMHSKLVKAYLNNAPDLAHLHNGLPTAESVSKTARSRTFFASGRTLIHQAIAKQYQTTGMDVPSFWNEVLEEKTFTITTGHQLCLFTGPLYFIYKILHAIRLAETMNASGDGNKYIPAFWMATEDHDFEEINHFTLFGKKQVWERPFGDAVGRLSTEGLAQLGEQVAEILGESENAKTLSGYFKTAYSEPTLARATRKLVHLLFGDKIIVIDGDDASLKKAFIPHLEKELASQQAELLTRKTNEFLAANYHVQVQPRSLNLFYLDSENRERLDITPDGRYLTVDSGQAFTRDEILKQVHAHPEKFSPNVILRPLYQEVILPNVAYIGGGGEIAYWLQLKAMFAAFQVDFPLLCVRSSFVWIEQRNQEKLQALNLRIQNLFASEEEWHKVLVSALPEEAQVDLQAEKDASLLFFTQLSAKATKTEGSLGPSVEAEGAKLANYLDKLEKRLIAAEKKKNEVLINQLNNIRQKINPNGTLQERVDNFSILYLKLGQDFFATLEKELSPFSTDIKSITY